MLLCPAGQSGYLPQMAPSLAGQVLPGPTAIASQAMPASANLGAPTSTIPKSILQQPSPGNPTVHSVQSAPKAVGVGGGMQAFIQASNPIAGNVFGSPQQLPQQAGVPQGTVGLHRSVQQILPSTLHGSGGACFTPFSANSGQQPLPQVSSIVSQSPTPAAKQVSSTPPDNKQPFLVECLRLPVDAVHERDGVTYYGIVVFPKGRGTPWRIMRRYNEFRLLHDHTLGPPVQSMEDARFPRKHLTGIFLNIDERRQALEKWLQAVVAKSEVHPDLLKPLRDFLTHHDFPMMKPVRDCDNGQKRILVIEPGFGRTANPRQGQMIIDAGYSMKWLENLPNPETSGFVIAPLMDIIKKEVDNFKPHLLVAASKGGAYLINSWETGTWTGPSLMINKHPKLSAIPKDINFVLCQGSNDETYPVKSRCELEELIRTSTPNRALLYYTADSGLVNGGQGKTRIGDMHNMASLLVHSCLPRLVDAALCEAESPELRLMRSAIDIALTDKRLEAEEFLGYSSEGLRRFWCSSDRKGMDDGKLFVVPEGSAEFESVATIFRASPKVQSIYGTAQNIWAQSKIIQVERVENGLQEEGNARSYKECLSRALFDQGVPFEPGLHTRWAFHGSDAVDSIVTNPMSGFQPLVSGSRAAAAWGMGTYFARDAAHCCDSGFCTASPDGTRKILLCLVSLGMLCLGDPDQKGILPIRQGQHRYNSAVDSLSNPEIYITQVPGAAYPAYAITFK